MLLLLGKPFCDTWWSIETSEESGKVELVFGTDIVRYSDHWLKSLLVTILDPFHNIYSRLLLASAAAHLAERTRKR